MTRSLTATPADIFGASFCDETLACDETLTLDYGGLLAAVADLSLRGLFPGFFPGASAFPGRGDTLSADTSAGLPCSELLACDNTMYCNDDGIRSLFAVPA